MVTSNLTTTPVAVVAELPAIPPDVRVCTLDNGLILILREDHSAPVVSAQAWCRAGSINEGRWLGAGLSHVLEHMLFKGTDTRPAGRIDQEVQEAGGYMNAYTSFDRTVYWINVPNTGAQVAIDVLADIIQHASLPPEELEKEKQVILREMDMNQDDPSHRSARRLFEVSYTRSPYRFTVIGYPDIFHEVRREDLVAYYREKYAPNNVFFVVVGDMAAGEVEAQVRAAFAQAKTRPLPPDVLPEEPKQMAPREVIEEASIELAHIHYSWHIPELRHPDMPLLDVLASSPRSMPGPIRPATRGSSASAPWRWWKNCRRRAGPSSRNWSGSSTNWSGPTSWPRSCASSCPGRWPAAKPCKARPRTWATAGWWPTI
jgi:zinc protease